MTTEAQPEPTTRRVGYYDYLVPTHFSLNHVKNAPCGAKLEWQDDHYAGKAIKNWSTAVNVVSCVGCLRHLADLKKRELETIVRRIEAKR